MRQKWILLPIDPIYTVILVILLVLIIQLNVCCCIWHRHRNNIEFIVKRNFNNIFNPDLFFVAYIDYCWFAIVHGNLRSEIKGSVLCISCRILLVGYILLFQHQNYSHILWHYQSKTCFLLIEIIKISHCILISDFHLKNVNWKIIYWPDDGCRFFGIINLNESFHCVTSYSNIMATLKSNI